MLRLDKETVFSPSTQTVDSFGKIEGRVPGKFDLVYLINPLGGPGSWGAIENRKNLVPNYSGDEQFLGEILKALRVKGKLPPGHIHPGTRWALTPDEITKIVVPEVNKLFGFNGARPSFGLPYKHEVIAIDRLYGSLATPEATGRFTSTEWCADSTGRKGEAMSYTCNGLRPPIFNHRRSSMTNNIGFRLIVRLPQ